MLNLSLSVSILQSGSIEEGEPLFGSWLIVSASCGLLSAYTRDILLVHYRVKECMMDPLKTGHNMHKSS